MMGMKMGSKLTDKQIQAYQLVAGEFEGLSTADAAKLMGISPRAINRLLKRAEKVCPSIFPLLTKQEARVETLLAEGYSTDDMADCLGVSLSRISQITNALCSKRSGISVQYAPIKMVRYESYMDDQIKEKF